MVDTSFPIPHRSQTASVTRDAAGEAGAVKGDRRLHAALFALFLGGAALLTWRGYDFYTLSVGERVDHPDFRVLGPGSNLGHGYGISGTVLILTNLLYLVRRKFARLTVGSLRAWLDVHVFTGLFGGMLVLFHSAFQARSTIAVITVVSLGLVMVTGLLGRYLYALSPKVDDTKLEHSIDLLEAGLPGLGGVIRQQLQLLPLSPAPFRPSLVATAAAMPKWQQEAGQRTDVIEQVRQHYLQYYPAEITMLEPAFANCKRRLRSEVRARVAGSLLKSWRGVHRLSALVMVAVVSLHIGVAWYYGFMWVFSK